MGVIRDIRRIARADFGTDHQELGLWQPGQGVDERIATLLDIDEAEIAQQEFARGNAELRPPGAPIIIER